MSKSQPSQAQAKPDGQYHAKVSSPAPLDGTDRDSPVMESRTSYLATFHPGGESNPIYYCLRWIKTTGESGPWGTVFASTVPAGNAL